MGTNTGESWSSRQQQQLEDKVVVDGGTQDSV